MASKSIDFNGITRMFEFEGLVALGKIEHPNGKSGPVSLEHGHFVLSVLRILEEKSNGNRTSHESEVLQSAQRSIQEALADLEGRGIYSINPSPVA